MFLPPGPPLVRVEQEDSLGEVGAGGVVAMGLLNTVLMLATLATLGRSAGFIIISYIISYYPPILSISIIDKVLELRWLIIYYLCRLPGHDRGGLWPPWISSHYSVRTSQHLLDPYTLAHVRYSHTA